MHLIIADTRDCSTTQLALADIGEVFDVLIARGLRGPIDLMDLWRLLLLVGSATSYAKCCDTYVTVTRVIN